MRISTPQIVSGQNVASFATAFLPAAIGTVTTPAVSALSGGGFAVVWSRTDLADRALFAKLYNADGSPVGGDAMSVITLDAPTNGVQAANARVAGLSGGGFVVAYEQRDAGGANDIALQWFDASGARVSGPTIIDAVGSVQGEIELTPLGNGGVAIAWRDNGWAGTGGSDITVASFTAAGAVLTAPQRLGAFTSTSGGGDDSAPDIARLGAGHLIVMNTTQSQGDKDLAFTLLSASGQAIAPTVTVAAPLNQSLLSIAGIDERTIAVAWNDERALNEYQGGGLRLQTFEIRDVLTGDAADDVITVTGPFAANIDGGAGNDDITGSSWGDLITASTGLDTLNGAGGVDTLDLTAISFAGLNYTLDLAANTFSGFGFAAVSGFEAVIDGAGNTSLTAGSAAALLSGGGGNDMLRGGAGVDTLLGGDGADQIAGGAGADRLDGGAGIDTIDLTADAYNGVLIDLQAGQVTTLQWTWPAVVFDTIIGFEAAFDGGGSNRLVAASAGSRLEGRGGNDTLVGAAGADTLLGGQGDDSVVVNAFGGLDSLDGGDGNDTLDVSAIGASGQTYQIDLSAGSSSGYGFASFARFEAVLDGAGDATMRAAAMGSLLDGGAGSDRLIGAAGNDTLIGGSGDDHVIGDAGFDVMAGGEGRDTIDFTTESLSGLTIDLGYGVTGSFGTLRDTLSGFEVGWDGGGGNRMVAAWGVSSRLEGRAGDDTLVGRDRDDTLLGGDGNDRIVASIGFDSVDGGVGVDTYDGTLWTFSLVIDLAGGTLSNGIDVIPLLNIEHYWDGSGQSSILGSAASNYLEGNAGADTLRGGDGADTLNGGTGGDTLDGGEGAADWASYYFATAPIALFVETPGSSTGEAAGDVLTGIEFFNLTDISAAGDVFFGAAAGEQVFGQAGNDILFGNGGDDGLWGGAGDDFLLPGAGADLIIGDAGFDAVYYGDSAGPVTLDLVFGAANSGFAAGDAFQSVEAFLLTEAGDLMRGLDDDGVGEVIYGLGGADRLEGRRGFDWLIGGDGSDTLIGGFGFDLLIGGAGADRFVFETPWDGGAFAGGGEVIADFEAGVDTLAFSGCGTGLGALVLGQNLFIGAGAPSGLVGTTTGPTLLYDSAAGALWFDANGALEGGLQFLASLIGAPPLTSVDFLVT